MEDFTKNTIEELELLRELGADNAHIPSSRFNAISRELERRHRKNIEESLRNSPILNISGGIGGASGINGEGGGGGGGRTVIVTKIQPQEKINWTKWGVIISVILATIGWVVSYFLQKPTINQNISNSPSSINTIGQIGNNTIVTKQSRKLTYSQQIILKQVLSSNSGNVAFKSKIFDAEAKNYADQLAAAFKAAGWNVGPIAQDLLDDFGGKLNVFITGFSKTSGIEVYDITSIPAFDQAGIKYGSQQARIGSFGGNLQENTLYIEVGSM